jgi:hypothetical protein
MIVLVLGPSVAKDAILRLFTEIFLQIVNNNRFLEFPAYFSEIFKVAAVLLGAVVPVEPVVDQGLLRVYVVEDHVCIFLEGGGENYNLVVTANDLEELVEVGAEDHVGDDVVVYKRIFRFEMYQGLVHV